MNKSILQSRIRELELKEELLELDAKEYEKEIDLVEQGKAEQIVTSSIKGIVKKVDVNNHHEMITVLTYPYVIYGELSEEEVKEVKVGQKVYVNLQNEKIVGTIHEVSPYPIKTPSLHETSYFPVTIMALDEQKLPFGHHLSVEIVKEESFQAVLVPTESIVAKEGETGVVYTAKDGRLTRRIVNLGILSDHKVEVIDGVMENEWIIQKDQKYLVDGRPFVTPIHQLDIQELDYESFSRKEIASTLFKAVLSTKK